MNKKGFTLVELLAVLAILAIILLIGIPSVSKIIRDNKQKAYDIQISSFLESAEEWAMDNPMNLPGLNQATQITLEQLIEMGYVEKDVENPMTGEIFDISLKICVVNRNNTYDYKVDEGSGCGI